MSADRNSPPLTLLETADLLGRYRYVELAAFAVLGRRAATAGDPAVARYLSGASRAHGHRAGEIERRLPVSVGLPGVRESTRAPHEGLGEVLDLLEAADDPGVVGGLIGALYPAMTAAYALHVANASPTADPPVLRMLGRLLADLDAVRRDGAIVAGRLQIGPPEVARRVEVLLMRVGGPFGPARP